MKHIELWGTRLAYWEAGINVSSHHMCLDYTSPNKSSDCILKLLLSNLRESTPKTNALYYVISTKHSWLQEPEVSKIGWVKSQTQVSWRITCSTDAAEIVIFNSW